MTAAQEGTLRATLRRPWVGPLVALVAVYVLFAALTPDTFLTGIALQTMARYTVIVGICAVGMTLVVVKGGIDLSIGSIVALTTVVTARALKDGQGAASAALLGVLTGAACGVLNGGLVAWLRITPFIVTLGTMKGLRGLAKGLADEQKIDADARGLDKLMRVQPDSLIPLPPGAFIALMLVLLGTVVLHHTRFGRHVVAVGCSPDTARLCGISIPLVTLLTYALAGALGGIAGVLEFGMLTVGDPTGSSGLELQVIAAVVIGGGSLLGGAGSVAGSLFGALTMTVIATGCTHLGVPNWVQEIMTGGIIVAAVAIDKLREGVR